MTTYPYYPSNARTWQMSHRQEDCDLRLGGRRRATWIIWEWFPQFKWLSPLRAGKPARARVRRVDLLHFIILREIPDDEPFPGFAPHSVKWVGKCANGKVTLCGIWNRFFFFLFCRCDNMVVTSARGNQSLAIEWQLPYTVVILITVMYGD